MERSGSKEPPLGKERHYGPQISPCLNKSNTIGQDKPLLEEGTINETYWTMVMERVANDG